MSEKQKTEFKAHIKILKCLGVIAALLLFMVVLDFIGLLDILDSNGMTTVFAALFAMVFVVILFLICAQIIRILKTWYSESYTDTYVKGTHYETTVKDDGTFVTKEVTEYGGGHCDNGLYLFFCFLLFPVWWLPRFIYLIWKMHS